MQPALYYRSTDFDPICAWCSKPLNEDLIKRLASKKETHSTVQPNCGEHGCLIRNVGGEDGTVLRLTTKKTQAEIQSEVQVKTQVSKAEKGGGSPCAKTRKE